MIQFNLLPDVKLQYVKARRTKHLISFLSFVIGGAALGILIFALFFVKIVQQKSIDDLNKDIKKYTVQLKSTKDLDKMLTVQNQLATLPSLHEQKPVVSRVFTYLVQITPANASLNLLSVDFEAHTLSVGGTADSLDAVKIYADRLKATEYVSKTDGTTGKAFTDVVLSSFAITEKGVTFTLTMNYEPKIFDVKQDISLVVPPKESNQGDAFGEGSN